MYSNQAGRFSTPDPTLLSVNGYNPQSWNRYVYVLNNPYLYTDPLGLWEITTETICKKNKDGTCQTYKNGENKVDKVIVTARKTQVDDNAASLAKQLGLTGKEAENFAEQIGDTNNVRLSEQGGLVGRVYSAVETGLAQQENWENKNRDKLGDLAARGRYGPSHSDCSRTACEIGLGRFLGLQVGTNVLNPLLDTEARNVAQSYARVGDIIRYAKDNNVATHFANFIFREDDGTPIAFSKSGEHGRYERRSAASLQTDLCGTIRGRSGDSSGYYRRR